jgi:hypothetical protein
MKISVNSGEIKNLNVEQPYNPALLLLGIYLKKCESIHNTDIFTHVYSSTVHNSHPMDQPRCPPTDEWMKKTS